MQDNMERLHHAELPFGEELAVEIEFENPVPNTAIVSVVFSLESVGQGIRVASVTISSEESCFSDDRKLVTLRDNALDIVPGAYKCDAVTVSYRDGTGISPHRYELSYALTAEVIRPRLPVLRSAVLLRPKVSAPE